MTQLFKKSHNKKIRHKVAIFDIDGTIFRSSLLIELTETLIREKIFPQKTHNIYDKAYKKWHERKGSYEEYIGAVVNAFQQNIKGVKHKDFIKIAKNVIVAHHNKVYRYTRDLVKKLQNKNYYLLAISNSPQEIVKEFCKTLGFNKIYGRIYEVGKNKRFTGLILYNDLISDKAKVVKRVIKKEGLILGGSIGVGDTESDIAFLKMVKTPICFNPNKNLYNYARGHDWKIVVERKDIIYNI